MFKLTWGMVAAVIYSTTGIMIPISILLWWLARKERQMDEFIKKYWHL
jgi:hypothetical protein